MEVVSLLQHLNYSVNRRPRKPIVRWYLENRGRLDMIGALRFPNSVRLDFGDPISECLRISESCHVSWLKFSLPLQLLLIGLHGSRMFYATLIASRDPMIFCRGYSIFFTISILGNFLILFASPHPNKCFERVSRGVSFGQVNESNVNPRFVHQPKRFKNWGSFKSFRMMSSNLLGPILHFQKFYDMVPVCSKILILQVGEAGVLLFLN